MFCLRYRNHLKLLHGNDLQEWEISFGEKITLNFPPQSSYSLCQRHSDGLCMVTMSETIPPCLCRLWSSLWVASPKCYMLFPLPKVFSFKETINSRKALWSPTVHVLKEGKIFMLFNHKYIYMAYKYIYICIHRNFILIFCVGLQKDEDYSSKAMEI